MLQYNSGQLITRLTNGVCAAELLAHHILHVAVLAQFEVHEVDLHLTVFDKHALLDHLPCYTLLVKATAMKINV